MFFSQMTITERQATFSLASIMALRMVGLLMVLPVFSLYAAHLPGATPILVGLSIGIYGLTQALLQMPFGMWSDHIGRKPVIVSGLILFLLGSILAANAHSIMLLVIGRALQGAGAIGSTIMAFIADFTREEHRTKAMAICGITIGVSFSLAMMVGPILASWMQVNDIFWLASILSFVAIVILFTWTPKSPTPTWHADTEPEAQQLTIILKQPELMRSNLGVFILHAIFTASFVVIPINLQAFLGFDSHQQWALYLPVLLLAFVSCFPLLMQAEKTQQLKKYFLASIIVIIIAEFGLWFFTKNLLISAISLLLFFTAFSLLEAFLPSLVSKAAPVNRRGTALGIYSSLQFFGIFAGGALSGWLYGQFGTQQVYLFCIALGIIWLIVAMPMKRYIGR